MPRLRSWVICGILSFCTWVCFAGTYPINVGNLIVIVPSYEGFSFTSDPNSPEFKKLDAQFTPSKGLVVHGFYYETTPSEINKIITIVSETAVPTYITQKQWQEAKNEIYQRAQTPHIRNTDKAKSETIVRESITDNELFNTYIYETKLYIKQQENYEYVLSVLESKTFLYLNGKMITLMIVLEGAGRGINAYDSQTVSWVKMISEATAKKIIDLNPPTEETLKQAKNAERDEQWRHWKNIILIIVGFWAVLMYYFFDSLPKWYQDLFPYRKKQLAEQKKVKQEEQQKRKASAIERQK